MVPAAKAWAGLSTGAPHSWGPPASSSSVCRSTGTCVTCGTSEGSKPHDNVYIWQGAGSRRPRLDTWPHPPTALIASDPSSLDRKMPGLPLREGCPLVTVPAQGLQVPTEADSSHTGFRWFSELPQCWDPAFNK